MYMRMLSRGGYSQIVNITDVDAYFSRAAGQSGTSVEQLVSRPLQLLLLPSLPCCFGIECKPLRCQCFETSAAGRSGDERIAKGFAELRRRAPIAQ